MTDMDAKVAGIADQVKRHLFKNGIASLKMMADSMEGYGSRLSQQFKQPSGELSQFVGQRGVQRPRRPFDFDPPNECPQLRQCPVRAQGFDVRANGLQRGHILGPTRRRTDQVIRDGQRRPVDMLPETVKK